MYSSSSCDIHYHLAGWFSRETFWAYLVLLAMIWGFAVLSSRLHGDRKPYASCLAPTRQIDMVSKCYEEAFDLFDIPSNLWSLNESILICFSPQTNFKLMIIEERINKFLLTSLSALYYIKHHWIYSVQHVFHTAEDIEPITYQSRLLSSAPIICLWSYEAYITSNMNSEQTGSSLIRVHIVCFSEQI